MELKVFPAPAVAGELMKVVESRIHNDGGNQTEVRAWQVDLIKTLSTPSYALIDPATGELLARHEGPEMDSDTFAKWLREALAE
jgi:hypothetical protein